MDEIQVVYGEIARVDHFDLTLEGWDL